MFKRLRERFVAFLYPCQSTHGIFKSHCHHAANSQFVGRNGECRKADTLKQEWVCCRCGDTYLFNFWD